ncbi:fumarate reductase/succinate dehydrogenase flavoprotein subunit [Synechococcus sp. BSF8S]|uniref:fumarate reductase/succinate dehydrogenase flavoprotein subunit n=1 Tax=Synechococcales TaxID=1890424 RepID=UPI001626856C|nr:MULTISPECIES: fumarate reductase/succinate dehydrogenase flavoprotein subunit [unclassified Synechococcus]MBC1260876.1 fumarate reductase/succinate dehydrogenase flavoprotein subunit [Synechococcus sp. BSF8S]MBC1263552.1 fumarate reductase/succinate dehydrogenase flavoprotein subunit [Synechococcus sp. BSA11S]
MRLDPRLPSGPVAEAWSRRRQELPLIAPANRRHYRVLVVGSGLAGASAAASLAEQGYRVRLLTYHDSPRRAHSVAAQGGINAARNYQNDGDSVERLFRDTVRGGDFRAREAGCHRLAEISGSIIDHCVALGVPFAREYGGTLSNRSFGGSQVSRTFYARGQTGQQLLYGVVQALLRQVEAGRVELCPQRDLLDLITVDGVARGAICRHRLSGSLETHTAHAVVLASGGYSNVFHRSTNAVRSNASAIWRAHRRGALLANPCFTQIHPTCIPSGDPDQSKLTLMSESLRNDGRVWLPRRAGDQRPPDQVPEAERDYFLERLYPAYGNMVPRDVASRRSRELCLSGHGVGPTGRSIYLDFDEAIRRQGRSVIEGRYGNLFSMYERITGSDPYREPMRIYPAPHYTMGGLWVDYHLMSTVPGLFVLGEANFSEHGANRLGASALMQGLADGLFIAPATVPAWLADQPHPKLGEDHPSCREALEGVRRRIAHLRSIGGRQPAEVLRRQLGTLLIESCGISRSAAGLRQGIEGVAALREGFQQELLLPDPGTPLDPELEKALQLEDYLELADLMLRDALSREESCGAHFREEHQSENGEALRRDDDFCHIAAWEWRAEGEPLRHQEPLSFRAIHPTARSYR